MTKTILSTLFVVLLPLAARAQTQEDDHATVRSGHDPAAEARGDLAMTEAEGTVAGENLDKVFGLGFGVTPGGVTGFEVEYYLANLMLNGHVGVAFFAPDPGDSVTSFALAGGAFFRWKRFGDLAVMLGGRLDLGYASFGGYTPPAKLPQVGEGNNSAIQFNIEAMLRAEYYFGGILSVHAEVGPVIAIIGEGGGVLGESWQSTSEGFYLEIPLFNLVAGFGVTIYLE
jgi:hypothetical protein